MERAQILIFLGNYPMTYSVDGQLLYRRGLNDAFIAPYLSFGLFLRAGSGVSCTLTERYEYWC
jgi:hypothetical protein